MSGPPERWQRADTNSPFSQMTVHNGNQVTAIPIVGWTCRGSALSVQLTNRTFTLSYAGSPSHVWRVNEPSPSAFFIELGYDAYQHVTSAGTRGPVRTS